MSNPLAPTTRMPSVGGSKPVSDGRSSGKSVGSRWRAFRRSLYAAFRSSGAWFMAVCFGALAVSLSWFGWVMVKVADASLAVAEVLGRGMQESLPQDPSGVWLWLAQLHPAWLIAAPFIGWFIWIVFKEGK